MVTFLASAVAIVVGFLAGFAAAAYLFGYCMEAGLEW